MKPKVILQLQTYWSWNNKNITQALFLYISLFNQLVHMKKTQFLSLISETSYLVLAFLQGRDLTNPYVLKYFFIEILSQCVRRRFGIQAKIRMHTF